jgi:hypothetical protein
VGARRHEDRVRFTGLDLDRADTATAEVLSADRPAPVLAAVGRLVHAGTGDAAAPADVRLARSGVDRVVRRVVRIELERRGVVVVELLRGVLPLRLSSEDVVRPPDAAACVRDPVAALGRGAVRVEQAVRRSPGCDVLVGHVDVPVTRPDERVDRVVRSQARPATATARAVVVVVIAARLQRLPIGTALRDRGQRDVGTRVRVHVPVERTVARHSLAGFTLRLRGREPRRLRELLGQRRRKLPFDDRSASGRPRGGIPHRRGCDERRRDQRDHGSDAEREPTAPDSAAAVYVLRHAPPLKGS